MIGNDTKTPSIYVCVSVVTDTAIVHTFTMKTMTENATFRKRSRGDFFENDIAAYSCGCLKTELFDNDESACAFALLCFLLAFGILGRAKYIISNCKQETTLLLSFE